MTTERYLIVLKPGPLLEQYSQSYVAAENAEPLRELREAFDAFDPRQYRGIARYPLVAYPSLEQQVIDCFEATGMDMKTDGLARRRFYEILDDFAVASDEDCDFLRTPDQAREVLSLLDNPERWEIIHVCLTPFCSTDETLGFDVAYWNGGFSIIADTIVVPRWHPPAPSDFVSMKRVLAGLNRNGLFDSVQEADQYKSYYKSRPWAETEDPGSGEFRIIRVDCVDWR